MYWGFIISVINFSKQTHSSSHCLDFRRSSRQTEQVYLAALCPAAPKATNYWPHNDDKP